MKRILIFFVGIGFFTNLSAQIDSQWRTPISNLNQAGRSKYLGALNQCQYFFKDSTIDISNIYKIEQTGKVKTHPLKSFYTLNFVDSFNQQIIFSGSILENNFHQGVLLNKYEAIIHKFSSKNKGITLVGTETNNLAQIFSIGLSSYQNYQIEAHNRFDELLIYKGTLTTIEDSLIYNVSSKIGYPVFSGFDFFQDSISAYIYDVSSANGKYFVFKIHSSLDTNTIRLTEYSLAQGKVIYGMEKLNDCLAFVTIDTLNENTEVVITKNNFSQKTISKLNLQKNKDLVFEQFMSYKPNLKMDKVNNRIIVSNIPSFQVQDSIYSYFSIDTNGNTISETKLNINEYFEANDLFITNFGDQIILDSATILLGWCKKKSNSKVFPFKFIIDFNSKFYIDLDSADFLHSPIFAFKDINTKNEFFVYGRKKDSLLIPVPQYFYFEKFNFTNFSVSIKKEPSFEKFYVFPNPTTSQINFTQLPQHLWVYNTTGALVYQNQNPTPTLNLNLPNGLYFLQAQFEEGLKTQTLIIQQQ